MDDLVNDGEWKGQIESRGRPDPILGGRKKASRISIHVETVGSRQYD